MEFKLNYSPPPVSLRRRFLCGTFNSYRSTFLMDHPCYKCGYTIEEGRPFCPHCSAPQIRVAIPEAAAEPVPALQEAAPATGGLGYSGTAAIPLPAGWRVVLQPCALAAGAAAIFMLVGLNPFVAAIGAGFLAVPLSRRHGWADAAGAGAGAKLGALSGLLLFAASAVLETLVVVVQHKGAEIRGEMMDRVQQAAARYPGPEVQPFLDFVRSPGGFAIMLAASLLFGLLAFIALGSLGGVLGVRVLGRRNGR